jgi:hypothetical protein
MAYAQTTKRTIAPRLASGDSRVPFGHGLPDQIKAGLRAIAAQEKKSMSWVMEELIIEYFGFRRPKYLRAKKPANGNGHKNGNRRS